MLCGSCGLGLAVAGSLGYIAWMVLMMVYSIQAMLHHGESCCTHDAFKWLWWICISSGLFALSMLEQRKKLADFKSVEEFAVYLGLLWLLSLGFAIGTQCQYLSGCSGDAHHAMFVYMWGNYAVAACITLCGSCFLAEACFSKKTKHESQDTDMESGATTAGRSSPRAAVRVVE